jgi:hypothetical protein
MHVAKRRIQDSALLAFLGSYSPLSSELFHLKSTTP